MANSSDSVGAIYVPSGAPEIRDTFLRDIRLAAIATGVEDPPIQPGTDWYMLGEAVAQTALAGYANGAIADQDRSVLTATGEELEEERIARGVEEVEPAPSSGKLKIKVAGPTTIPSGQKFLLPNGLRGQVIGTYVNPADGAEIDVQAVDVGSKTNLAGGTIVRFVSPPTNIDEEATVSYGSPLAGGTDEETDGRKRERILNALRNKPAGGNWADIRRIALAALGSLTDCYVYPALGGPGSCLIVPTRDYDVDNRDFTRTLSAAALQTVRSAIHSQVPNPQEMPVRAAADELVDFTVLVTIPDSALAGGNGQGWTDQQPWPRLVGGDSNKVTVSAVGTGNDQITVTAGTSTAPYAGQTHVAWWSTVDLAFQVALVVGVSGSSGAWVLSLDRPFVASDGTGPAIGDYICPAAQNLLAYGTAWRDLFRSLGPGEMTTDVNRLPRAKRHPYATDEDPHSLNSATLGDWAKRFREISGYSFGHAPQKSPSVPLLVSQPPNILKPRCFAIYAE